MIEQVDRDVILSLRHRVLRPLLPLETAIFAEDDAPGVLHLATRDESGVVVGCATFFPQPLPDLEGATRTGSQRAWQLRGMATEEAYRGRGIGGALLEYGVVETGRRGAEQVWCNGRASAGAFYLRHGFVAITNEFVLRDIPHYVFLRELRAAA